VGSKFLLVAISVQEPQIQTGATSRRILGRAKRCCTASFCPRAFLVLPVREIRLPFLGKGRHPFFLVVERKQ
jgi:hypothetical protein